MKGLIQTRDEGKEAMFLCAFQVRLEDNLEGMSNWGQKSSCFGIRQDKSMGPIVN